MTLDRRHFLAATSAGLLLPWSAASHAQAWPERAIRLVSPYGAGGSNDILTRVLGDFLGRRLGQAVVVENRAGAGTRIANDYVAKAPPDGYTLLHAAAPIAIGEALYKDLPYDVHKSFDGFKAINGLSLVIARGELRAVVGPNGAGKTTMLDIVTGKTRPDSGRVVWGTDTDLTRLDEAGRKLAG